MKMKILGITFFSLSFHTIQAQTTSVMNNQAPPKGQSGGTIAYSDTSCPAQDQNIPSTNTHSLHYAIYGDFIYWNAFVSNYTWEFAYPITGTATYKGLHFDWKPGFRIGANFKSHWLDLIFDANWTRFYTVSSQTYADLDSAAYNVSSGFVQFLRSLIPDVAGTSYYAQAKAQLSLNQVDMTIKKGFEILGNKLLFLPFAGYRLFFYKLNTDQQFIQNTSGATFSNTFPKNNSPIFTHNHSFGQGLILGLKGDLKLGYGFDFFTSVNGALVVGNDQASRKEYYYVVDGDTTINSYKKKATKFHGMADIEAGASWNKKFSNDTWGLCVRATYEAHMIFNSPSQIFSSPTAQPNLTTTLHGLSVGAGVKF